MIPGTRRCPSTVSIDAAPFFALGSAELLYSIQYHVRCGARWGGLWVTWQGQVQSSTCTPNLQGRVPETFFCSTAHSWIPFAPVATMGGPHVSIYRGVVLSPALFGEGPPHAARLFFCFAEAVASAPLGWLLLLCMKGPIDPHIILLFPVAVCVRSATWFPLLRLVGLISPQNGSCFSA